MTLHACTIVARNYLPAARVLAASFFEQHPDGAFTVLLIDDRDRAVDPTSERFDLRYLDEIGISAEDLHVMSAIYDPMELAVAAKPWLLEVLLGDDGAQEVVYLDADIRLYDSLDEVVDLAERSGIVLTPHVTAPMARDGKLSDETTILGSGSFNLGFLAVSSSASDFLDFWKERLRRDCIVDKPSMHFGDQRWIDFVPGMFSTHILRDTTYNVAYWNLDGRAFTWSGERYEVDGRPLHFFHFSGYNPEVPHLLSKHQGTTPRILLSEHPAVLKICDEYRRALFGSGYRELSRIEYGYGRMLNGVGIDTAMRRLYREAVVECETRGGALPPNPFEGDGSQFLDWIAERTPDPNSMPRYLGALWRSRPDLQRAFPDPEGADAPRFAQWARVETAAGSLDPRVVSSRPERNGLNPPRSESAPMELRPGVRVVGQFGSDTEIGDVCARLVRAMQEQIEVSSPPSRRTLAEDSAFGVGPTRDLNVNLVSVTPDNLPRLTTALDDGFFAGRFNVALLDWPYERFPEPLRDAFDRFQEVWVTNEFSRQAVAAGTGVPTFVIPPTLNPIEDVDRSQGELRDGYRFVAIVDLTDDLDRQNPIGIIEAYVNAFEPGFGAFLVIGMLNTAHGVDGAELVRRAASRRDDVELVDVAGDRERIMELVSDGDCFVTLHRSVSFGLSAALALLLGKPLITTRFGGIAEYVDESIAYIVDSQPAQIPMRSDRYRTSSVWAEPDLGDAAHLMRHVFENRTEAAATAARGRLATVDRFSDQVVASRVLERFASAQDWLARPSEDARPLPIEQLGDESELVAHARSAPSIDGPTRHPFLARLLRRLVSRGLRNYDEHQRSIHVALARQIDAISHAGGSGEARAGGSVGAGAPAGRPSSQSDFALRAEKRFADHAVRLERIDHYLGEIREVVSAANADMEEIGAQLANHETRITRFADPDAARALEDARRLASELRSTPEMWNREQFLTTDSDGRDVLGFDRRTSSPRTDRRSSFADLMREPRKVAVDRLRRYLPILLEHEPVLDLNSGRGEMLQLLVDAGHRARGVATNAVDVEASLELAFDVTLSEPLEFLKECEPSTYGAIFCSGLIGKLTPVELDELLASARSALKANGILLIEAANPYSLSSFRNFWFDPSSRAPVFPEVLLALCAKSGFDEGRVDFVGGIGSLYVDRWRQPDYAVVARRREA